MMYKLKYLPLAQKDIRKMIEYISDILKVPKAAMDLLNALDESISRLEQFPYSCKIYQPIKNVEKNIGFCQLRITLFSMLLKNKWWKFTG